MRTQLKLSTSAAPPVLVSGCAVPLSRAYQHNGYGTLAIPVYTKRSRTATSLSPAWHPIVGTDYMPFGLYLGGSRYEH